MDMYKGGVVKKDHLSVDQVFKNIKARRAGVIKALTTDVKAFFQQCDPAAENLCLYGLPNGKWRVREPPDVVDDLKGLLPEPSTVGINFSRDGMILEDWLSLIAERSDSWLLALANFIANRNGLIEKADRLLLFSMINDLPTILEVVTGYIESKGKSIVSSQNTNKSKSIGIGQGSELGKHLNGKSKDEEKKDYEYEMTSCGACRENFESLIRCKMCKTLFHGKCVDITLTYAQDNRNQFKCPLCSSKRAQPKNREEAGKQPIEEFAVPHSSTNKSDSSSKGQGSKLGNHSKEKHKVEEVKLELDYDEKGENFCGACGKEYVSDEFWICCDMCDTWFHGQCMNITQAEAELVNKYKCRLCSNMRVRTR